MVYQDFVSFMSAEVLPKRAANPNHIRLDGRRTGGNRDSAGEFVHHSRRWVVHADTHHEPLEIAFTSAMEGDDPFIEEETEKGRSLCLRDDLRAQQSTRPKHLYIYLVSEDL